MYVRTIILICASIILVFSSLSAQEVQIPIDDDARLSVLTAELENEIDLFPEYRNFYEARLFLLPDSTYVLEVTELMNGNFMRDRKPMTREEMRAFRIRVSERIKARAPQAILEQEGRTRFVTTTTALALGYYGWAIPMVTEMEGTSAITSTYLLTGAAGFLIPYLATAEARVTDGMAILSGQGGVRGIIDGMLIDWMVSGDDATDDLSLITMGMLGSLTEMVAGYVIADNTNITGGKASAISVGGNFGLIFGLTACGAIVGEDADDERTLPAAGLIGSGIGYAVGNMLSNNEKYTEGDASVLGTAALLGSGIPPLLMLLTDTDEAAPYLGVSAAGTIAGIWLGHELIRGKEFTTSQGTYIGLGTAAGVFVGAGIAYAVFGDDPEKPLAVLTSAGALAGFALLYSSFADKAAAAASSTWKVNFNPAGLFADKFRSSLGVRRPVPFLQVQATF